MRRALAVRALSAFLCWVSSAAMAQAAPDGGTRGGRERSAEDTLGGAPFPDAGVTDEGEPGRPDEASLFGAGPTPTPAPGELREAPAGSLVSEREARDEAALLFPQESTRTAFERGDVEEDPLKIGGQFYLRASARFQEPLPAAEAPFSFPTLLDAYFDARPSERIRGMVVTRFAYDPAQVGPTLLLPGQPPGPKNPRLDVDQLWLRFDVGRRLFITAGKQHVKWGASRFWNPTDYLSPIRRDPLAVFDARLGTSMVKLHMPWEERNWNFYAFGLVDNYGPARTLGEVGGAARAEFVVGTTELGLDWVAKQGFRPRYGFDISSGLGPFDVYGEVALRRGTDVPVWRLRGEPPRTGSLDRYFNPNAFDAVFELYQPQGTNASASGGFTWTFHYTDADTATVGVEYFYNRYGYTHPAVLVPEILVGGFTPFYAGRNYLGFYALFPAPLSFENANLVLSNLMNLSDPTGVARADLSWRVHSYLTVETYAQGHYGALGEFRLGVDVPARTSDNGTPLDFSDDVELAPLRIPIPVLELGLGLRINL